jgi:hypothetical protein
MALDFSVLQNVNPVAAFYKGQEDVAQNRLAQQKMVQDQETNALRHQEAELSLQRTRGLMQRDEETQKRTLVNDKVAGFRERMLRARTPEDARQIVKMQYGDSDVSPILSQTASLEQALAEVPDDPNEFRTYLNQEAMGMSEWLKSQAEANVPKVVGNAVYIPSENRFVTAPQQRLVSVINAQGQPVMVPADQAAGMTPLTAATARMTGIGAPSRAVSSGAVPAKETATVKPMTELQQRKVNKERVDDLQGVKAATTTANELEKITDELAGNPAKKIPPHPGYSKIIGFGALTPTLPEGDAARAEQKLETFKGKIATFGRQLATQYGKLGNMALGEWKIVSDSIQNINPRAGNLDEQMRDVVRLARDFEKSMQEKYNELHGNESQQPAAPTQPATKGSRTVTRTGKIDGRRVVQYSDGSVEYAD